MNLILHRIIDSQDLGAWSRIKRQFFAAPYDRVYDLINKFYQSYTKLPTFAELEIITRNERDLNIVKAMELVEVPEDLETEVLLRALINEYAQTEVLGEVDSFIDDLPFKEAADIVEDINRIAINIEEKTEVSEQIVLMNEYLTIDENELLTRMPLGINNEFDQHSMGMALSEMIMFGGYRGTGKSIISSNIACNQFNQGNTSLYFSIEMRGREIFQRNLSILTGVSARSIKSGKLDAQERLKIAEARASFTKDGAYDLLQAYMQDQDFDKFEKLVMDKPLDDQRQLITVDNPRLTLANIDATISTYKAKFPDTLKVVIVDYLNKITERDSNRWDVQIAISQRLKELARKYEVIMVTPYQTHKDTGEARFSKGILDSADWAFSLAPHKIKDGGELDAIEFICQKARGESEFNFNSHIEWNSLKIFATENPIINKSPIKGAKHEITQPEKSKDDL